MKKIINRKLLSYWDTFKLEYIKIIDLNTRKLLANLNMLHPITIDPVEFSSSLIFPLEEIKTILTCAEIGDFRALPYKDIRIEIAFSDNFERLSYMIDISYEDGIYFEKLFLYSKKDDTILNGLEIIGNSISSILLEDEEEELATYLIMESKISSLHKNLESAIIFDSPLYISRVFKSIIKRRIVIEPGMVKSQGLFEYLDVLLNLNSGESLKSVQTMLPQLLPNSVDSVSDSGKFIYHNTEFALDVMGSGCKTLCYLIPSLKAIYTKNLLIISENLTSSLHPKLERALIEEIIKHQEEIKGQLITYFHINDLKWKDN